MKSTANPRPRVVGSGCLCLTALPALGMNHELGLLQARVYPQLRDVAKESGFDLHVVDMRAGLTDFETTERWDTAIAMK